MSAASSGFFPALAFRRLSRCERGEKWGVEERGRGGEKRKTSKVEDESRETLTRAQRRERGKDRPRDFSFLPREEEKDPENPNEDEEIRALPSAGPSVT